MYCSLYNKSYYYYCSCKYLRDADSFEYLASLLTFLLVLFAFVVLLVELLLLLLWRLNRLRMVFVNRLNKVSKQEGCTAGFDLAYASMHESNTSFILSCVSAEHSMYLKAPIFCLSSSPSRVVTNRCCGCDCCCCCCDWELVWSLKSTWVPTRIIKASGKYLFSSGIHFVLMFSIESGRTTLKQSIITSVSGYAITRRVSQSSWPAVSNKLKVYDSPFWLILT